MKHMKRLLLWLPILVISLLIATGSPVSAAEYGNYLSNTSDLTVQLDNEYKVIDGVYEAEVTLKKTDGTIVKAHVLLVKPDAKASFKPVIPGYYFEGSTRETRTEKAKAWTDSSFSLTGVTNMIKQYNSAADTGTQPVIAAINGGFSNDPANTPNGTGTATRGPVIMEGNTIAHSATADDEYLFGSKENGALNIVQRTTGQIDLFEEAICGGAYILRNGSLFGVDSETDSRQRTGIALRTNGDTLLITVENPGISVKQLAELMKASGCVNGVNMDGGGSIHMSTKRDGDSELARRTPLPGSSYTVDDNNERKVTSALMLVADETVINNVADVETEGSNVTTDKTEYVQGDPINVTASSDVDGAWVSLLKADDSASATSYFWYYTYGADGDSSNAKCWENGATYDICQDGVCSIRDGVTSSAALTPGDYRVSVLTYADAGGYEELATSKFTIKADSSADVYDYSLKINNESGEYEVGEPILTTITAPAADSTAWVGITEHGHVAAADNATYYWYYNTGTNGNCLDENGSAVSITHSNGSTYDLLKQEQIGDGDMSDANVNTSLINRAKRQLLPGKYDIILYKADSYTPATDANGNAIKKTITIVGNGSEDAEPIEGSLTLSGASRTDKLYTGKANYEGNSSDFYYGDSITVEAEVSGAGAEGAWVGIVDEDAFVKGNYSTLGGNWYFVEDFEGQAVNLNYVKDGKLQNTPNYASLGWRWVVLVSGSGELLDGAPFFNRTFNMDWLEGYEGDATWGEAAKNKIRVEAEWTSRVANGEEQKPEVVIKRVNGHFGYEEGADGELVEITEEVLKEGVDYTIEYPETSKEVGEYNIKINFFSSGNDRYLSTKPQYYGLADGVTYYLTESSSERVIRYELNDGKNHKSNPAIFNKGDEVIFKNPTKVGYCFDGWYTTPDFKEGTKIEGISKDETNDVTVYAKWTFEKDAPYTIKYVLNGGDNPIENPSGYTGETDLSIIPGEREGYIFKGWYFDTKFKYPADTIKKGTKGNLTLFAKYVKARFDIDTEATNGKITADTTVKNGASLTVEYEAYKGYMLKGVTVNGEAIDIAKYPASYTIDKADRDYEISAVYGKADLAAPASLTLQLSTAKKGYDNVKLSWSAVKGAAGYKIYYKRSSASKWNVKTVEGKTVYTTGNLYDGYKYSFRVIPFIKNGDDIVESGKDKGSTITTLKKISTPKLSRSGSKVKVSWTNISGETGYQISRSTKKSGTNIVSTYKTTSGKSKLVKATKGKKYYYKVRAYKSYKTNGKYVKVYGPWSTAKAYRR